MADFSLSAALEQARAAAKAATESVTRSREAAASGNVGAADAYLAQSRAQSDQSQQIVQASVAAAQGDVAAQARLEQLVPFWRRHPVLTAGGVLGAGWVLVKLVRGRRRGRR